MFLKSKKLGHLISPLVLLALSSLSFSQQRNTGSVEFSLRSIDGQTVTSDSLKGEVVVLAFGASWLPLSKTQLQGVRRGFLGQYGIGRC
jgi:hypothetical protein